MFLMLLPETLWVLKAKRMGGQKKYIKNRKGLGSYMSKGASGNHVQPSV